MNFNSIYGNHYTIYIARGSVQLCFPVAIMSSHLHLVWGWFLMRKPANDRLDSCTVGAVDVHIIAANVTSHGRRFMYFGLHCLFSCCCCCCSVWVMCVAVAKVKACTMLATQSQPVHFKVGKLIIYHKLGQIWGYLLHLTNRW